jgi:hypothetical protein
VTQRLTWTGRKMLFRNEHSLVAAPCHLCGLAVPMAMVRIMSLVSMTPELVPSEL